MNTIKQLQDELAHEYHTTKKFFERFPEDQNNYAPHEKSMKMMPLATHISEIFGWPPFILSTDTLDFGKGDYKPTVLTNATELQDKLEADYKAGVEALNNIEEKDLEPTWSLSNNGQVLAEWTKYGAIRHGLSQIIHHRAQLGVYYRLLDIPLPGSYGPSADEQKF
ncbi:MAG TPA: DinB family protein [Flavipsychrobacter sp.]|nr:DinB family protein [Flavipsychrobacter sp.]